MPGPDTDGPAACSTAHTELEVFHGVDPSEYIFDDDIVRKAELAAFRVRSKLLHLAREIGETRRRNYIGFSAFIIMALSRRCRPKMWIGENLIDLVHDLSLIHI